MNVKYAITRIKNKFSRDKVIIDGVDREAINSIIDFYNDVEKADRRTYVLFHKLFIYTFLNRVLIYDNDADRALITIEQILKRPLSSFYETFSDNASYVKTAKLLKELGYKNEFLKDLTDEQIKENDEIIDKNRESIKKSLIGGFSIEQSMKFIDEKAMEMILKYKNHD